MRALKILGLSLGGLIVLAAALIVAVLLFVNPNDYRDRIARAVKGSTGRELTLSGDLHLSVFPQLALTLGRASLGNPPGFGKEPFAAVNQVSLRVKLLPLLHRELQVGRIEIDGLDLRLAKDAEGKGNWEGFGKDGADATTQSGGQGLKSLDLAGLALTHSRIAYGDLIAENLNLELGRVAPGVAIPVTLSLAMHAGADPQALPVSGSFTLTMDPDTKRYGFAALTLRGSVQPKGAPAAVPWTFATPELALDLRAQTLAPARFDAQLGVARLSGSVAANRLLDAPALQGDVDLKPLSLRELMTQLGLTPPATRDHSVLSKLGLHAAYAYTDKAVHAERLAVQLDDTRLEGRLALNFTSGAKDFDLTLDRIDLDRYLPPPAAPTATKAPFEVPGDTLKALRAKGTLDISQVAISGIELTALKLSLDARDGLTQIAPAKAQLYGGQYTGNITVDMRGVTPTLKLAQTMAGIDVARLLQDFAKTKRLSGKGTLAMDVTAQGANGAALMKTLRGTASWNLADGAVEGIDLWYGIAQAQSLIQKQTLADTPNTKRTAFDTFKASADIKDGVATTKDLAIASQLLRVSGQGSTNLVTQALDYRLTATVLKAPPTADAGLSELALATIPVQISGTFDDPKVRPDIAGLAKARVQKEIDKRRDDIKAKLQDTLKGLLNR
jgi:AsmA protein